MPQDRFPKQHPSSIPLLLDRWLPIFEIDKQLETERMDPNFIPEVVAGRMARAESGFERAVFELGRQGRLMEAVRQSATLIGKVRGQEPAQLLEVFFADVVEAVTSRVSTVQAQSGTTDVAGRIFGIPVISSAADAFGLAMAPDFAQLVVKAGFVPAGSKVIMMGALPLTGALQALGDLDALCQTLLTSMQEDCQEKDGRVGGLMEARGRFSFMSGTDRMTEGQGQYVLMGICISKDEGPHAIHGMDRSKEWQMPAWNNALSGWKSGQKACEGDVWVSPPSPFYNATSEAVAFHLADVLQKTRQQSTGDDESPTLSAVYFSEGAGGVMRVAGVYETGETAEGALPLDGMRLILHLVTGFFSERLGVLAARVDACALPHLLASAAQTVEPQRWVN